MLLAALKFYYGYDGFRAHQQEAIEATLQGKDSLLILPTGGGKSITFQLPALAKGNCFTVVVGPLVALAKDQVDSCCNLGIDARVWNSESSEQVRKQILSELISDEPEMRLLYTTPESLCNPTFRSYLKEAYESGTLLSFAIDEAHCVSEWGHDFRPAYLQLATLKQDFPNTPIAALTASVTANVQANLIGNLRLKDPLIITGGFNRPNISYKVAYKELVGGGSQDEVVQHLVEFIRDREGQCGIIYARLRATCDWLCSTLNNCDLDVGCYHAGKDATRRRKVQQDWCEGGQDIVVATVAFGMGIDRADVRWVVHWDVPASLEGFYQESGRAGRDGLPSESVMYVGGDDLDTIAKLEKGSRAGSAAAVADYSCQPGCRRRKVLAYFGQNRGACNASKHELLCDYCSQPQATRQQMEQWEQQLRRKAVQHMPREQRKLMQATAEEDEQGCAEQTEGVVAGSHSCNLQAKSGSSKQQSSRPKVGVWGSARVASQESDGAAAPRLPIANTCSNAASMGSYNNSSTHAAMQQATNNQCRVADSQDVWDAVPAAGLNVPTTATGVRAPKGPAAVPQLARKRPRLQPGFGAFKAPRVMQDTTNHSSRSTAGPAADSSSNTGLPLAADNELSPASDSSSKAADWSTGQQKNCSCSLYPEYEQKAYGAAKGAAGASSGTVIGSRQQAKSAVNHCLESQAGPSFDGAVAAAKGAQIQRRQGLGRHAFRPPLKI